MSAMKLSEALQILNQPLPNTASPRDVFLACGFTPLHLKTFLAAYLRKGLPTSSIKIETGLYGDLAGNLERLQPSPGVAVCAVIEWTDLDQRLGIRSLGSWRSMDISDIVESAYRQSERLTHLLQQLAEKAPTYVCTPTLPLPPIFISSGSQVHRQECELREIAASLASRLSSCHSIRLISGQRLDELSPLGRRFDPKSEITSGFPYGLEHASRLAELMAALIRNAPPKKGIVTDLDDTLWAGLLGEIGSDRVSWAVSGTAHLHGLYQRFLESLASAGVLLAIASKNDLKLAEEALAREDMLLSREKIFPLEINWGPKSASVHRILEQWNIASEDVVFIDDSPMEIAEVQSSFPEMECIVFPKVDHVALWELLKQLRDQFGKTTVSAEDDIRLHSIRSSKAFKDSMLAPELSADNFLRGADATISFSLKPNAQDHRALELINKTNQFNLNGRRLSESEWVSSVQAPNAFVLTATYEDKYSPLGKIAVAVGKTVDSKIYVDSWVMSCRAFSRRIEHQCIKFLYKKLNVDEIVFDYEPTARNEPIRNFFLELLGETPKQRFSLQKASFNAIVPALFHRVVDLGNHLSAVSPTE